MDYQPMLDGKLNALPEDITAQMDNCRTVDELDMLVGNYPELKESVILKKNYNLRRAIINLGVDKLLKGGDQ